MIICVDIDKKSSFVCFKNLVGPQNVEIKGPDFWALEKFEGPQILDVKGPNGP